MRIAGLLLLGCSSLTLAQGTNDPFGTIGEGCTSESRGADLLVAWRVFSGGHGPCDETKSPYRLIAVRKTVSLKVNVPFPLRSIRVVATDEDGRIIRPVPVMIEADTATLDLEQYILDPSNGVVPRKAGTYHLRVRGVTQSQADIPRVPAAIIEINVK